MIKLFIITMSIIVFTTNMLAQTKTISFNYDNAGNRTARVIEVYNSGGLKSVAKTDEELSEEIVENKNEDTELQVYPNPFREVLYLTVNEQVLQSAFKEYQLYNLNGQIVLNCTEISLVNEIKLSELSSGTYILKLLYDAKQIQWTVIKP